MKSRAVSTKLSVAARLALVRATPNDEVEAILEFDRRISVDALRGTLAHMGAQLLAIRECSARVRVPALSLDELSRIDGISEVDLVLEDVA